MPSNRGVLRPLVGADRWPPALAVLRRSAMNDIAPAVKWNAVVVELVRARQAFPHEGD
jgi:hypothetical protein